MTAPDFGVDFEPMVIGRAEPTQQADSRVIDGPPARPTPAQALANVEPAFRKHNATLAPMTARELRKCLRARLAVVKAEIRARARLEAERDELIRLLAAASGKPKTTSPRADVRPIRNVAG